ncbi:hypothetical protein FACS1894151_07280 [Spirochaetia bacterium]|nr:hypothetical protein FACS1894151_07280 [Spirochaetia bacterium]
MEKKKLLLVAVSVGVFLVIVIGACILVFPPKTISAVNSVASGSGSTGLTAAAAQPITPGTVVPVQPASVDPADMVRRSEGLQDLQNAPISAQSQAVLENNFYIYGENSGQPDATEKVTRDVTTNTIIDVSRPTAAAVPDTARTQTSATQTPPATVQTPSPTASTPAARTTPAAVTQTPASAVRPATQSAGPATQTAPAVQTKTRDAYWVQTGSFSTKALADSVKDTLAVKGITSVVENRDVDGKLWYRVRVGPYTTQTEADYWLILIKSINGFENSLIFKNQVAY